MSHAVDIKWDVGTTYRAGVMPDSTKSHSWVALHHAVRCIVLHDLVLHQGELLGHLHRLLLVGQHVLRHFVDYLLSANDVVFLTLNLLLKFVDLVSLVKSEGIQFVFLLQQGVPVISHFAQLVVGALNLTLELCLHLLALFLLRLDFLLHALFVIAGRAFELLQVSLGVLELTKVHLLHLHQLLFSSLYRLFQVID